MVLEAAQLSRAEAAVDETEGAADADTPLTRHPSNKLDHASHSPLASSLSHPAPLPLSPPTAPSEDAPVDAGSLVRLFRHFLLDYSASRSSRSSGVNSAIQQRCVRLFCRDYLCDTLDNAHGEYCSTYPPTLILCRGHKPPHPLASTGPSATASASAPPSARANDTSQLSSLFKLSRFNRVHGRFVCPVLLVDGVNISRSSTLAIPAEALYNNVATRTKELFGTLYDTMSASFPSLRSTSPPLPPPAAAQRHSAGSSSSVVEEAGALMSAREADEELLRRLSTRYIVDLMVEHRKKKLGVTITSSEKSEQQLPHSPRPSAGQSHVQPSAASHPSSASLAPPSPQSPPPYADFTILPIPYPGCEFFALYHDNGRSAVGLVFDWTQSFVDSLLTLEESGIDLAGLELSGEGEDEDGLYEYDTHWACWMHQQQSDSGRDKQKPARMAQQVSALSHPSAGLSTAAPSAEQDRHIPSTVEQLTDVLDPEQRADEAGGRIRQSSAAQDDARPPQWRDYKEWSIATLTKNYLLLLLHTLASNSAAPATTASHGLSAAGGLSLHCISGWDRTPLFISLLRLSLWADGEAHASLSAAEMLYLTLAYDWMFFSHQLANRHDKGEDIMYACFDMLQYITADKFSLEAVKRSRNQPKPTAAANGEDTEAKAETGVESPVTITAPEPASAASSPTAAAKMDDAYFSAERPRSPAEILPSSSSTASLIASSPIAIPTSTAVKPLPTSLSTADISTLPASPSPTISDSPLLSSGGSSVGSDGSSAMPRNGSWTLVNVLEQRSEQSDASAASLGGQSTDDEATGSRSAQGESRTPPSHPAQQADLTSSWTAAWSPLSPVPSDSTAAQPNERREHPPASAAATPIAASDVVTDGAADMEQSMRRARRCQRLLELRGLFLQTYHAVLPVSPNCRAAAVLDNHPTCPHFQSAKRLEAQLPTVAASIDGDETGGSVAGDVDGDGSEQIAAAEGSVASGKSSRMLPWLPF